jgi:N-acetyl-S-(2-succino)cysteine monooxygenase
MTNEEQSMSRRQLHLNAFLLGTGHHVASWRHPDASAKGALDFAAYRDFAQQAEAAKFDALFLADSAAIWGGGSEDEALYRSDRAEHFEPLTLLSSLAAVTEKIGLIATVTTTYNEPFHLARKFASLDHLSGGRAGWNLVTSSNEAEALNFNQSSHAAHADRYQRAEEFIDVARGLWDSWEEDAFVRDKASGLNFEPAKLHVLDHQGPHFQVRGPLNVARPVQGYPVLVQAGSSEPGKELAARTAEVVFTAQQTLENAQAFYADLKGRLAKYGRSSDSLKILPGIFPVVGKTLEEAEAKYQALQDLIHPAVGLALLSAMIGIDLSAYDINGPLPDDLPESNGGKSRQALLIEKARRENLSIKALYLSIAGARGHYTLVGTPETIADTLQTWFEQGAADGFNIMPALLPNGLTDFIELVVPILQARGLFRTEYEGHTLRDRLGLKKPQHPKQLLAA